MEWARLERREPPKPNHLLGALFDRYEKKIIPTKSIRTQSDSLFLDNLLERRSLNGIKTSTLITNASGLRMSQQMLRNRWDEARDKAAIKAGADGDPALAVLIRQFQFKDIRPKAASEIELAHASRLLGHSTEEMTKKVYRRVGEIVNPTK